MSETQKVTKISEAFVDSDSDRFSFEPPTYSEAVEAERRSVSSVGIPVTEGTQTDGRDRLGIHRTEGVGVGPPPIEFHEDHEDYSEQYTPSRGADLHIEVVAGLCIESSVPTLVSNPFGRSSTDSEGAHKAGTYCEVERVRTAEVEIRGVRGPLSVATFAIGAVQATGQVRPVLHTSSCGGVSFPGRRPKVAALGIVTEKICSIEKTVPVSGDKYWPFYALVRDM